MDGSLATPAIVAKAAITVEAVGRLRDEFEALGVDWHQRGRRTDEALAVLRCRVAASDIRGWVVAVY